MPSTSAKQAKFMRAVAHSPSFAKKVGVPQSVGKDFSVADKKTKKFGDGGETRRPKPAPKPTPKPKPAPGTNDPDYEDEGVMTKRKGGTMKKRYDDGGEAKGGKMKKFASGGLMSGHKSADGIAKKGKTRGMMPKMAKGGKMKGCK